MKKKYATLYTIGYGGRTPDDLVAVLKSSGATRVVDVRQMPLSRKPGFSKSALSAYLESHGIEYVGFPRLGTPPAIRKPYKQRGDFARLKRDYLAYLRRQGLETERLRELTAQGGSALLCFERDPARCHRSILAGVLAGRGGREFHVVHLGFDEVSPQGDLFAEPRPEAGSE
jgi:uncharacterized protein (DUF488 family)